MKKCAMISGKKQDKDKRAYIACLTEIGNAFKGRKLCLCPNVIKKSMMGYNNLGRK